MSNIDDWAVNNDGWNFDGDWVASAGRGRAGRGRVRGNRARGGTQGRGANHGRRGHRGRAGSHGRGASGNRGASRGRSGFRGRSRQGFGVQRNTSSHENTSTAVDTNLDIKKDLKQFFVGTASFDQHYEAQEEDLPRYIAGMVVLKKNGVEISQNARIRALAAAWARHDIPFASFMLSNRGKYGLVEVLKAVTLLDAARKARVQEKKIKHLQIQSGVKVQPKVFGTIKSDMDNYNKIKTKHGSASGAVCRHIRQWTKTFTKEELELYALHFPKEPWKNLADICHFNPKQDFTQLPWFLGFCFGESAPEGSMANLCRDLNDEVVNKLLKDFNIPYTHVKTHNKILTNHSKARIAGFDRLDQIIWYYEQLECKEVDEVIKARLESGEELILPYGKLMERLLTIKMLQEGIPARPGCWYRHQPAQASITQPTKPFFNLLLPMAQRKLESIRLDLEAPIVVMADRSPSMDIAIRASTIIASMLTVITSAKLVFFDEDNMDAPFIPTNVEEVLKMAVSIQTGSGTSPAASLYPFYEKKEVVKTFIVVTDEEENMPCNGMNFWKMYQKYVEEVHQAKLVFVSFLHNQHDEGDMVSGLHAVDIHPMQFKFDPNKPDFTKLENLFGLLASDSDSFEIQAEEMRKDIVAQGFKTVFENLTNENIHIEP